jgi:hypothetical protein
MTVKYDGHGTCSNQRPMDTRRSNVRSISRRRHTTAARPRRSKPVTSLTVSTDPHAWWDIDAEVLATLADGAKSPGEIGECLGMSEQSVTSIVTMLAQAGKVRIRLVEASA